MRFVIAFVGVVAALAAWLSLDGSSVARQRLTQMWTQVTVLFGADGRAPVAKNWGDVAHKVGEFATEERGLREILNPPASPTPATQQPAAALPAAKPAAP